MSRPINLEKLEEATDEDLMEAHAAALTKAHDAPYDRADGSMSYARFAREANRIGAEIDRRKRS